MPFRISSNPEKDKQNLKAGDAYPISKDDFNQGIKDFEKFYMAQFKTNKGLLTPLKKSEIDNFVAEQVPASCYDRALIVFYHGYDRRRKMIRRGVRVVVHEEGHDENHYYKFDPKLDEEAKLPSHEFVESALEVTLNGWKIPVYKIKEVSDPQVWQYYQDDYYIEFTRHLAPKDPAVPVFTNLNKQEDPKAVYFPYKDEIEELGRQNNRIIPWGKELYYIISDYASYINEGGVVEIGGDPGYYHSLSIHTAFVENYLMLQLLDNNTLVNTLEKDGIDYGHLCPPRCDKAKLDRI